MGIENYKRIDTGQPYSNTNTYSTTERIQKFVKYLHDFMPVIKEEFEDLERRNKDNPNQIFPIKMNALHDIYMAAGPLYKWYIEKRRS